MRISSNALIVAGLTVAALAATPSHAATYEVSYSGATWALGVGGTYGGQFTVQTDTPITTAGSFAVSSCSVSGPGAVANSLICPTVQYFDPNGYNTGYSLIEVRVENGNGGSNQGLLFFESGSFTTNGVYPIFTGTITDPNGGLYGNFAAVGTLTVSAVPEPKSLVMLLAGVTGFAFITRRRRI
jgi:hypothetical protein